MSRTSRERIEALFASALEQPPEHWVAYLATAIDDPEASREVLSLLLAHQSKGRFDSIADQLRGVQPAAASVLLSDLLNRLGPALAGRYTIERELGRGGMALVFLARDVKHGRTVAIKVLRPEISVALGNERFMREIQLAARLQHPRIVPLYDSGVAASSLYYVMPYVDGESLRERLNREQQLSVEESLSIARDVAAALAHAHSYGVVHRDIKPENILLSDGGAVVADFGIARAITVAGDERLTETGFALGTPAYMSPEQATARAVIDGRSDIYALGCVLYEMLGGEPPFSGPSAQAILARHALDPVPNLKTLRGTVPGALVRAIERALSKSPADRFKTAAAFETELEAAMAIAAPAGAKTIVAAVQRIPRRIWTFLGLGSLAVAAAVTVTFLLKRSPVYSQERVIFAPLENWTGDSALDDFAEQLLVTLPSAIAREGVGEPVPAATIRDLVVRAKGSPGQIAEWLARETRAGLELRGACHQGVGGTTCQVDLLRMPAKALRMSVSVTGDPKQPAFGAQLTERLLVALFLQRTWGDRVTWLGEYLPRSLAAVRAFKQACCDGPQEWRYYGEAARLDTGWVEAAAWAAWDSSDAAAESIFARLARRPNLLEGERQAVALGAAEYHVFWKGKVEPGRSDADVVFELYQSRFAINPEWFVMGATYWAEATGRSATAVAISRYADSAIAPRGRLPPYVMRGDALHHLGRFEEELQLAREIERRFPTSERQSRTYETQALAALGKVDSLRRRLAEWEASPEGGPETGTAGSRAYIAGLELIAHGREREGRAILAATLPLFRRLNEGGRYRTELVDVLLETAEFEEARRVALSALRTMKSSADSMEWLGMLGCIAARRGRRDEAARYDQMLAVGAQRSGRSAAWGRSLIAGFLGDREVAVRFLEETRPYGDPLYRHAHRQLAYVSLRNYPPFQRFLKSRE